MRKKYVTAIALAVVMTMLIAFSGCGGPKVPERLIGEWDCAPLASDEMTDTSFYALTIEEDGTYSLYDKTTGKSAMSGTMKGDDTGKLGILELTSDEKNFDPPACWAKMQTKARVRYKILDEAAIKLGYVGIWLTFTK